MSYPVWGRGSIEAELSGYFAKQFDFFFFTDAKQGPAIIGVLKTEMPLIVDCKRS